jgi:hypothetical protein
MTVFADTAGWIGAIAAIIGIPAAVAGAIAVFKWFRPEFRARIDGRRQAIRLDVDNKGRASGRIRTVAPVDAELAEIPAEYPGVDGRDSVSAEIPGRSAWFLIIEAAPRESAVFPEDTRVFVRYGRRKERQLELEPAPKVGYWGMNSNWPE